MNQNFIIGDSLNVRQASYNAGVVIEELNPDNEYADYDLNTIVVDTNDIPRLIFSLFVLYLTNLKGTLNAP